MPMEAVLLEQKQMQQLEREAEKRGVTCEELAAELMRRELDDRTKPRNPRGKIAPFRRKG
ncbi:MAG: hypothetical protein ACN6OP_19715 [Pseudomonadales bacterium]